MFFRAICGVIIFPFFITAGSIDSGTPSGIKDAAAGRSPHLFNASNAIPADKPGQLSSAGAARHPSDSINPAKDTLHAQPFGPDSASILPFARGIEHPGKKEPLKPLAAISQKKEPKQPLSSNSGSVNNVKTRRQRAEKFLVRLLIVLLSIAMTGCFVLYLKNRTDKKAFVTKTRLSIMDKEVQKACNYIEKNYRNSGLSVDTICTDLITGKAFLEALFKQELGIEIDLFITHVRINRARMLLEHKPGIDAAFAATETGFLTTELFCSAFSMIVGVSFEYYKNLRTPHAR